MNQPLDVEIYRLTDEEASCEQKLTEAADEFVLRLLPSALMNVLRLFFYRELMNVVCKFSSREITNWTRCL